MMADQFTQSTLCLTLTSAFSLRLPLYPVQLDDHSLKSVYKVFLSHYNQSIWALSPTITTITSLFTPPVHLQPAYLDSNPA